LGQPTKKNKKASRKQEKSLAAKLHGRTTWGSGSGWAFKQDVIADEFLAQCKLTFKKSISIQKKDLISLKEDAALQSRIPLMEIVFQNEGYPADSLKLYILFEYDFIKYLKLKD
jgi:hypothetical protein